jgi:hypothetical protein
MPFLKQLLRQPLTMEDLRDVDPVLYKHKIEGIMNCSEEELEALDQRFVDEHTEFGSTKEPTPA